LTDRVPQPFLFGVYGIEPTEEMVRVLRDSGAAGIFLLRRNIETTEQVRMLVEALEEELGYPLLVAVEHEGGLVYRFTRGITFFPGNAALGKTGTPALAYEVGRAMARELSSMAVSINLAPLLDLSSDEYNPELALRTFGNDPALASDMGAEMIRGLQEGGVSATARHFPGRGAGVSSSRLMPVIPASREALLEREAAPFRVAIAGGVDLVQSASALYTAIDAEHPAMLSPRIVTDLLRREMGFNGAVVTEDLSSPAVLSSVSVEEAVVRAIQAGNDLALVAHDYDLEKRAYRGYKLALDSGRISKDHVMRTTSRLQVLLAKKEKQVRAVSDPHEAEEAAGQLASIIAGAAMKVEADPQKLLPLGAGRRVGVLVPRVGDLADRIAIDEELRGAASLVQAWVQEAAPGVEVLEVPVEPDRDMLGLTLDWAAGLEVVVFFCFDAHRYAGQRKLLEELQARCPRLAVVLIRNPWDRAFVKENATVINTFGFRVHQLWAAVSVLFPRGAEARRA
jgi:beta-N-acetylhexosaminidase